MSEFAFQISAAAVKYLQEILLATLPGEEPLVLCVSPYAAQGRTLDLDPVELTNLSHEELTKMGLNFANSLSTPIEMCWEVGGMRRSRLPAADFRLIDGIECFLPEEIRPVLNGRTLQFENGELRFEPELVPPAPLAHL